MRTRTLLLPVLALVLVAGRKPTDPKYEKHMKTVGEAPATDVVALELVDAHSQAELIQVAAKVHNKSNDQLVVVQKEEASFVLPDGKSMKTKATGLPFSGRVLVPPSESKSYTFKVDADGGLHVDSVTLKPAGIYAASNTGKTLSAPDFQLPPSQNAFTTGPFSCNLVDRKQETDETAVKFSCAYNGKGVGYIDPRRIGIKAKDQEFANDVKKGNREILFPGDTAKFTAVFHVPASVVDMQFATMQLLWRDAFAEAELKPVNLPDWKFELDPEKTAKANE